MILETFDLAGQTAFVTGGSRGLGRAIAEGLGEAGARVVVVARREKWLREAEQDLEDRGIETLALSCDVTDPDDVRATVEEVERTWGRVDTLVNNAGIAWAAPFLEFSLEDWKKVMEVNLTGAFIVTQTVGERMVDAGAGTIINMSSVTGLRGCESVVLDSTIYNTTKGGMISFTQDLAVKWAPHGVRVNALAPGFIPTRMTQNHLEEHGEDIEQRTPMGRLGERHEVKGAAVFLASEASSYMTGSVITLDGGMSASC